jgi:hypothetical protein
VWIGARQIVGRAGKINRDEQLAATGGLKLGRSNVWWRGTLRERTMRLILAVALGLASVGAAHAQIQPIRPPANPYALPQPPGAAQESSGFKPYKPPSYMNPGVQPSASDPYPHMRRTPGVAPAPPPATAADPYPSLHRKHRAADDHF